MAKSKTVWYCSSCGNESLRWMGVCPACGEWNTMVEAPKEKAPKSASSGNVPGTAEAPVLLSQVDVLSVKRLSLASPETDRLLGGGVVPGSLVLIGGEPGIGKSTLSLQIPLRCKGLRTLYVSGEESAAQVRLRADRLGGDDSSCYIYSETLMENVVARAKELRPDLLVVDSVQTMYSERVESSPGTVTQIRECASMLLHLAKETGIPVFLIGHITKDGTIAGPKVLEHIVDVVLQFEGDSRGVYRVLRSIKNRFGPAAELAVFEMTSSGLREVANPSEVLLQVHGEPLSGIAVSAVMDGSRPFLIETQALVSSAAYGTPQRSATGYDVRRMNMLLAVLEKRAGFKLGVKDVFLNMAGGLKVTDPACDMAVITAVLSSNFDLPVPYDTAFFGEVGLSGEIRPVPHCDRRIAEAARTGFRRIFIPSLASVPDNIAAGKAEIVRAGDVQELCRKLFRGE